MSRLDELPADQKAVLQLLLKQGKSYADLGGLLRIDELAVRERALDALESLGADAPSGLNPSRQDEVSDYLLGQQSAAEADTTRTFLEGSAAGRAWARAISGRLEPIARDPLPLVPDEAPEDAAGAGDGGRKGRRAKGGERSSRLGGLALLGVGAVLVAVVLVALLTRNNDDSSPRPAGATAPATAPASTPTASTGTSTTDSGQIESQINMTSSGGDAIAVAYALNRKGQRVLGIAGQKFPPTNNKFSYAVWLYTSPTRATRLGFVANGVSSNGRLVTGADPTQASGAEAARLRDQLAHLYDYKQLIITRETSADATRPGPIVVAGPIRRPAGVTG